VALANLRYINALNNNNNNNNNATQVNKVEKLNLSFSLYLLSTARISMHLRP